MPNDIGVAPEERHMGKNIRTTESNPVGMEYNLTVFPKAS